MKPAIYEQITNTILGLLDKGQIPWRLPWTTNGPPRNLISKRPYRGINAFLLGSKGFISPFWVTEGELSRLGGKLREGKAPTQVVLWKWVLTNDRRGEDGPEHRVPFLWSHFVFNTDQCAGIKIPMITRRSFSPINACERIVKGMPNRPTIEHGVPKAFYDPVFDSVNMPNAGLFVSNDEYYSTLFHELVHSVGHHSRLNRHKPLKQGFRHDDHDYSQEELVAECGGAYLCALARISPGTVSNSAAYIQGWLNRLNGDKRFLFFAALQAQKAVDFIRGKPLASRK